MATKDNIIDWAKRQLTDREVYNDEYDRKIRSLMRDLGISFDVIDSAISGTLGLSNNLPQPIGTSSAGTDVEASRSDHVHEHGNQLGGSLHSIATPLVSGFMSVVDKIKLDGIETNANNTVLSNADPTQLGSIAPGIATEASRSDHVHEHGDLTGGTLHEEATTLVSGFLSSSDKIKLNSVESGATNTPYSSSLPQSLGTSDSGTANFVSRADHVHEHGNQLGGTLHSTATTVVSGFMSFGDKSKLDSVEYNATASPFGSADPLVMGTASPGGTNYASREDHVHPAPFGAANLFLATPSGSAGQTTLRSINNLDIPANIDSTKISSGIVDNTEFDYLDGLTSNIQTQLNSKIPSSRTITAGTGLSGGGSLVSDITINVSNTTVTSGSYPDIGKIPTFTANSQGQLTAAGSTVDGSNLDFLNASNLSTGTVAKSRGGFGQDVSMGLTDGYVATVSGGAITIGAMTTGALPNSGVVAGTYPSTGQIPVLTIDSHGLVTTATSTTDGSNLTSLNAANISTGVLTTARGGTGNTTYAGHGVVVADSAGTAFQSTNAPTAPGQHLIWDGVQWLPGVQTGTVYYFRRDASDIGGGYEQITQTPQTGAEKTASSTLNNASGTVVFDTYATNLGEPGLTQLLAGTWEFDIYGQVSSTAGGNTTNFVLQFYKRTTGGTETLLFSTTSPALDSTSVKLYSWLYTQPSDILLDITDRLVVKVAATNSSVSNRTVTFYYEGTTHYSHFHPSFLSLIDGGALVTIGSTQTITGAKTFSIAPVMSGANVTSSTLPGSSLTAASVAPSKITGGTANRILYDNGTGSSWTSAPGGTNTFLRGTSPPAFDMISLTTDVANTLPTYLGGTGLTTFTSNGILYANTAASIGFLGPTTSGYVLTATGVSTAPGFSAPITNTTGAATLGSTYNVTTSFANTGLSVSLPSSGKYRVWGEIRCQLQVSVSTGNITIRLYDSTAGSAITNSERISGYSMGLAVIGDTVPISIVITVSAASTIDLQAMIPAGPTYLSATVVSDGSGRSRLFYEKIGP